MSLFNIMVIDDDDEDDDDVSNKREKYRKISEY